MAIKTQEELQTAVDTVFADNAFGAISAEDCRTFLIDLIDTAEDRWGAGVRASSPADSPQISAALDAVQVFLAQCVSGSPETPDTGCISPQDLRDACSPIIDLFFPDAP